MSLIGTCSDCGTAGVSLRYKPGVPINEQSRPSICDRCRDFREEQATHYVPCEQCGDRLPSKRAHSLDVTAEDEYYPEFIHFCPACAPDETDDEQDDEPELATDGGTELGVLCDVDNCDSRIVGLDDGWEFSRGTVCQDCIDYQSRHGHWPDESVDICAECRIDDGMIPHECEESAADRVLIEPGTTCDYCGFEAAMTDGGEEVVAQTPTLKFAEEHIDPILKGQKTMTLRLSIDREAFQIGRRFHLCDEDGERFASAFVEDRGYTTAAMAATMDFDGHRNYRNVNHLIEELRDYYPNAALCAQTPLEIVRWNRGDLWE